MNPSRQVLRYYGSKHRIGEWLASFDPIHHCFVDVYGGGANRIFTKQPSLIEVYNDLNEEVVTFFRVLRERPDDLIRAIELTPYSRRELAMTMEPTTDPLEIARQFYIKSRMGRASSTGPWKNSWRYDRETNRKKAKIVNEWNNVDCLWEAVDRLKNVYIECDDALDVIKRYDASGTLFYLDPPYPHNTRYKRWLKAYRFEMTEVDHIALARVLWDIKGMAMISSYPNELYDELYTFRGWQRHTTEAKDNQNHTKVEAIWLNPAAQQGQKQLSMDLVHVASN